MYSNTRLNSGIRPKSDDGVRMEFPHQLFFIALKRSGKIRSGLDQYQSENTTGAYAGPEIHFRHWLKQPQHVGPAFQHKTQVPSCPLLDMPIIFTQNPSLART
jgi:hypothetical protein